MEDREFDDFSRTLAASGSRRVVARALAALLGFGLLGAEAAEGKRKRERRRQRRKRNAQGGYLRGIKVTVGNPLTNDRAVGVELGFDLIRRSDRAQCCQGQAAYTLQPGESREYTTEENGAYLWVENRYFLQMAHAATVLPFVSWAIDGASYRYSATCCKPRGTGPSDTFGMEVGETRRLDVGGRPFTVQRLDDDPEYKVFLVLL